eukprot:7270386-Pyramimonas_sp.AAC.1
MCIRDSSETLRVLAAISCLPRVFLCRGFSSACSDQLLATGIPLPRPFEYLQRSAAPYEPLGLVRLVWHQLPRGFAPVRPA